MAEWKKVIVSGSNAELNQVTASYFKGDGSGLTNVMAGSVNLESFPDGTGITVSSTDKLLVSDGGTEKYINVSQLPFTVNTNTQLSQEAVEDFAGALVATGGTKTGITVTYDDANGNMDFVVASQTDQNFTNADHTKLDGIEADAEVNRTDAEIKTSIGTGNGKFVPAAGTAGHFLKHDGTYGLPSYTVNTNTQLSNAEVRTAVEAADDSNVFTDSDHGKLDGIEAGADVNRTAAETRTLLGTGNGNLVPAAGSSGEFLKHDGTFGTPSYTVNTNTQLSNAQVRTAVDAATDSNVFTDADHTKLDNIEALAQKNRTAAATRTLLGTGNNGVVPAAGSAGQFLKHDGTFGTPSYTTNTDTDVSVANLKTRLAGGFGSNAVQIGDSNDVVTIGNKLVVTGDLLVSGTTTTVDTANLNVTDKFINLNDGGPASDGGIVIEGQGTAFGWDNSKDRWAFDFAGATEDQAAIVSDAFAVAVTINNTAGIAGADANYAHAGNIMINGDNDIFIYTD